MPWVERYGFFPEHTLVDIIVWDCAKSYAVIVFYALEVLKTFLIEDPVKEWFFFKTILIM